VLLVAPLDLEAGHSALTGSFGVNGTIRGIRAYYIDNVINYPNLPRQMVRLDNRGFLVR